MQKEKNEISLNDKVINFVSNNIVWIFLVFIVIVINLPNLFARLSLFPFIKPDGKGLAPNEIGDAIGGMTAPIIGLFSAFLVYIAFRAQIKANEELQKFNERQVGFNELNELKIIEESLTEDLNNLHLSYIINPDTDTYLYGNKSSENNTITLNFKGKESIYELNNFIYVNALHSDDLIEDYLTDYKMNNYSINNFLVNVCNYYKSILFYTILLNESSVKLYVKRYLLYKTVKNHKIDIKNIDDLIFKYNIKKHPKFTQNSKILFKQIKETNESFKEISDFFLKRTFPN